MRGIQNLSYQELIGRRAKGLCFKCGQHYSPMHRCPDKELKLIVHEDEERNPDDKEEEKGDEEDPNEWELVCHVVELSELKSHAKTCCKTMKLEGSLLGVPILILIDSGASHNYVTKELVLSLNCPITETRPYVVSLGDGSKRISQGRCEGMRIKVGPHVLQQNAYVLELGGIDMILGMEWLETLGEVKTDWRKQIMSYEQGGKVITLEGYQIKDENQTIALQEILVEEQKRQIKACDNSLEDKQEEELQRILQSYQALFQEPQGLPPKRDIEHAINLKQGTEPVNVRPYKYAYHHKDEIEKQVKELLQAGAIKQSVSPFSSLVILVKKKDGSWRMCG